MNDGSTIDLPDVKVHPCKIVSMMLELCETGIHELPLEGCTIQSVESNGKLHCNIMDGIKPLCSIFVAANDKAADELWPMVDSLYLDVSETVKYRACNWASPKQPSRAPWCAIIKLVRSDLCDDAMKIASCMAEVFVNVERKDGQGTGTRGD